MTAGTVHAMSSVRADEDVDRENGAKRTWTPPHRTTIADLSESEAGTSANTDGSTLS